MNKFVVTVWKDGTSRVWGAMDAFYAQADEDFLCNIGVLDILNDVVSDAAVAAGGK